MIYGGFNIRLNIRPLFATSWQARRLRTSYLSNLLIYGPSDIIMPLGVRGESSPIAVTAIWEQRNQDIPIGIYRSLVPRLLHNMSILEYSGWAYETGYEILDARGSRIAA